MKNTIKRTRKTNESPITVTEETIKIISEEDIRKRAFEIYINSSGTFSERDNWFYAERELNGYYN